MLENLEHHSQFFKLHSMQRLKKKINKNQLFRPEELSQKISLTHNVSGAHCKESFPTAATYSMLSTVHYIH